MQCCVYKVYDRQRNRRIDKSYITEACRAQCGRHLSFLRTAYQPNPSTQLIEDYIVRGAVKPTFAELDEIPLESEKKKWLDAWAGMLETVKLIDMDLLTNAAESQPSSRRSFELRLHLLRRRFNACKHLNEFQQMDVSSTFDIFSVCVATAADPNKRLRPAEAEVWQHVYLSDESAVQQLFLERSYGAGDIRAQHKAHARPQPDNRNNLRFTLLLHPCFIEMVATAAISMLASTAGSTGNSMLLVGAAGGGKSYKLCEELSKNSQRSRPLFHAMGTDSFQSLLHLQLHTGCGFCGDMLFLFGVVCRRAIEDALEDGNKELRSIQEKIPQANDIAHNAAQHNGSLEVFDFDIPLEISMFRCLARVAQSISNSTLAFDRVASAAIGQRARRKEDFAQWLQQAEPLPMLRYELFVLGDKTVGNIPGDKAVGNIPELVAKLDSKRRLVVEPGMQELFEQAQDAPKEGELERLKATVITEDHLSANASDSGWRSSLERFEGMTVGAAYQAMISPRIVVKQHTELTIMAVNSEGERTEDGGTSTSSWAESTVSFWVANNQAAGQPTVIFRTSQATPSMPAMSALAFDGGGCGGAGPGGGSEGSSSSADSGSGSKGCTRSRVCLCANLSAAGDEQQLGECSSDGSFRMHTVGFTGFSQQKYQAVTGSVSINGERVPHKLVVTTALLPRAWALVSFRIVCVLVSCDVSALSALSALARCLRCQILCVCSFWGGESHHYLCACIFSRMPVASQLSADAQRTFEWQDPALVFGTPEEPSELMKEMRLAGDFVICLMHTAGDKEDDCLSAVGPAWPGLFDIVLSRPCGMRAQSAPPPLGEPPLRSMRVCVFADASFMFALILITGLTLLSESSRGTVLMSCSPADSAIARMHVELSGRRMGLATSADVTRGR
jgi:hypothetical protein